MQTLAERIGPKGEIKLPKHALEALGVKLDNQKLIEEIVESEEWL